MAGNVEMINDAYFQATMIDCWAGPASFIGDGEGSGAYDSGEAKNSIFINCRSVGMDENGRSGSMSFASCGAVGLRIAETCYFENCHAGEQSFALGRACNGTFVNCTAGHRSFGFDGSFGGKATGCRVSGAGFGARTLSGAAKCSGELTDCETTGLLAGGLVLEGAVLRNCKIATEVNGASCLVLADGTSKVINCEILVKQGGTGLPITATSARNVVAAHCRMNNATNDPDGLGANVTNLVASACNVVSNAL
jgi:hypothetical protein